MRLYPDVIEGVGFEDYDNGTFVKDDVCISVSEQDEGFVFEHKSGFKKTIYYVHELQNLWNCICSKELNAKDLIGLNH